MKRWNRNNSRILSHVSSVCLTLLLCLPALAFSEEIYRFDRLWPTLLQPWYFRGISAIALDSRGNVYIADRGNNRIRKFTPDGHLITEWGRSGHASGELSAPISIAVDGSSYVYVAEADSNRIQKFTADGAFVAKWDRAGSGAGELDGPVGVAVDPRGNVYVSDHNNFRIQKFTGNGKYLAEWGRKGSGDGEFGDAPDHGANSVYGPWGLAIAPDGSVYVADPWNNRVQKFTSEGKFIAKWGVPGSGNGQFAGPWGIAVDAGGHVYVTDFENNRVQKFTSRGKFMGKWGSCCDQDGQFYLPQGIAVDAGGTVYVGDDWKLQKFTAQGRFLTGWRSSGGERGEFRDPEGLAVSPNGEVYVADTGNSRIQKFSADGRFLKHWGMNVDEDDNTFLPKAIAIDANGSVYVGDKARIRKLTADLDPTPVWVIGGQGTGTGRFASSLGGLAIDKAGNIYSTDGYCEEGGDTCRVQKFTSSGEFITKWGEPGSGAGQFLNPAGIAVDDSGKVFVVDTTSGSVQKFTSDGGFVKKWHGGLADPRGVTVDGNGYVYVADTSNHQIQRFDADGSSVSRFGRQGSSYGQMSTPYGVAVDQTGRVYVADTSNNRIQVFKRVSQLPNSRAVILAGGGPYAGNLLWAATEMCANFAYRALTYQGFAKEQIYYLNPNRKLDLDGDGVSEVSGAPTKAALRTALTSWAKGASDVIVYLVDHGGEGSFRMSGKETLSADDLAAWLSELQQAISGKLIVIYDACQSGSFLSALSSASGNGRIVITSTSPGEDAYFVNHGSISFSSYFWSHIFNGLDIFNAFDLARKAIEHTTSYQHPLLDDNGNGQGNDAEDGKLAAGTFIGNGTDSFSSAPSINAVSPDQTITGTSSAVLYADGVSDSDGIARVWAVIRPPNFSPGGSGNPIQELPATDLTEASPGRYEATYNAFNVSGTYQVAIYAMDRIGNTSIPKLTTVSAVNPLRRKAILVGGGSPSDPLWPAIEKSLRAAYDALIFQGYTDEDISFMSPVTIAGVDQLATRKNLRYAVKIWARQSTYDLMLYLVGKGENGTFQINSKETLSAKELESWLNSLQASLPGTVTTIYDASSSGSFLPALVPPKDKSRILISSTASDQPACFVSDGELSFSRFFWTQVANGAKVRECFNAAAISVGSICPKQTANLDDNGNGQGNELTDGELARYYSIGTGIILAGDAPVIGAIMKKQVLKKGQSSATIWVRNVTTTGTLGRVWAVITPPDYQARASSGTVTDLPVVELLEVAAGRFEGRYAGFSAPGSYAISVFAMDTRGNVSQPYESTVIKSGG